MLGLKHYNRKG